MKPKANHKADSIAKSGLDTLLDKNSKITYTGLKAKICPNTDKEMTTAMEWKYPQQTVKYNPS